MKARSIWLLLLISFAAKVLYILSLSGYEHHLFADMSGYWERANSLYRGDIFSPKQWVLHPPLTHFLIFVLFKVLAFFRLFGERLPATLILFAFLSTCAAGWVYRIIFETAGSRRLAFWGTFCYAFSFPIFYYNSVILSENFAIPFLTLAAYLILQNDKKHLWLSGMMLALATGVRPNLGIIVVPFSFYLLWDQNFSKNSLPALSKFLFGFLIILLLLAAENSYISKGVVKSFAPNAGTNFFIQQCKPQRLVSTSKAYGPVFIQHPAFSRYPENGIFLTERPFFDQNYFFKKGWECIRAHPAGLLENFVLLKAFWAGPFFPVLRNSFGFQELTPIFKWIHFLMLFSLLFAFFIPGKRSPWFGKLILLVSIPIFTLAGSYFVGMEGRYLIPCLSLIYAAFFIFLPQMRKMRIRIAIGAGILLAVFLLNYGWEEVVKIHRQKVYQVSDLKEYDLERFHNPRPEGAPWSSWGNLIFWPPSQPVLLKSRRMFKASEMEISADCNDSFKLSFYRNNVLVGNMTVPVAEKHLPKCGLATRRLALPSSIAGREFNRILAQGANEDKFYSIGHVRFN
ncbi:MAG: glycosyltransferase family 39 protein [Candidatus Omnitrophica bacterium]|nr:glycosyltransferase family 39 protein [Candidatus Omnitrophota bacterium]